MEQYKWFVEQKFYDNGKVEVKLLTKDVAKQKGYQLDMQSQSTCTNFYDLWVDGFNDKNEAIAFKNEALNC